MALTRSDHIIVGSILLKHRPHCLYIFGRVSPIAARFKISKIKFALKSHLDSSSCARDLTRDEGLATTRRFMIEQNTAAGEQVVALTVIGSDAMSEQLRTGVRASGLEGCAFVLKRRCGAVHLTGRRLIE